MDSKVLRPMRIGLPRVHARKRLRSSGRRHGRELSRPITPFWAMATISEINGGPALMAADYCRGRRGKVNVSPRGAVSYLDGRIEYDDIAEGHAEELRGLRAVLLHACKQPALQTPQPGERPCAYH